MRSIYKVLSVLCLSFSVQIYAQSIIEISATDGVKLEGQVLESFQKPWAMAFLPDGSALVTEKTGAIWLLHEDGTKRFQLNDVPQVEALGQGGMGDIIVHPDFAKNKMVFLSYIQRDGKDGQFSGAVVERAKLIIAEQSAKLSQREVIWTQSPKVTGNGHYAHRLAISPDGFLFITSGERQKFTPAQNMAMNLGKVVRINPDGTIPKDNPFFSSGPITNQIWTLGHRNPLGIDFDHAGNLWVHEMGPRHGDELNLIERGSNYGYPNVSEGSHYSGVEIPSHASIPIYNAPIVAWVPAISPAGFIIYKGSKHGDWTSDGFIGGLSSQALIRLEFTQHEKRPHTRANEAARYSWGKRVREVEQNSNGDIFVLEDGETGRLIRLSL